MKRFIYIIITTLILFGCDGKDEPVAEPASIVKSNVVFTAEGGNGTIEVSSPDPITSAEATETWCTVAVNGNVVNVSVPVNTDISGRTAMVNISTAGKILQVAVTQSGAVLSLNADKVYFASAGEKKSFPFKSNLPVEVVVEDAWLSYTIEGDAITFTAAKNADGFPRSTSVTLKSGKETITVTAYQVSFNDLIGDWTINYTDFKDVAHTDTVTLARDSVNRYVMNGLPRNLSIKVNYNPENASMTIVGGQYLGKITFHFIYLCMFDSAGGYITWSDVQYEAPLATTENQAKYVFSDNRTWVGRKVDAFMFYAFTSQPPSSTNGAGYYNTFKNLILTKNK